MPSPLVFFYVSGHGFGHARRAGEVARHLLQLRPDLSICFRTMAPAWLFDDLDTARISVQAVSIDPGAAEDGPLCVSPVKTADKVAQFMAGRDQLISSEIEYVRQARPALVLADISFAPGPIAAAGAVPCIGISNFTWDWIYQSLFDGRHAQWIDQIQRDYAAFTAILRPPSGEVCPTIPKIIDCPLIARRSLRPRQEILGALESLGLRDLHRPRVLVGMRGGFSAQTLASAAASAPEFDFLFPEASGPPATNLFYFDSRQVPFVDLLAVSDVVVSKLGYGIAADCLAARVGILWPRRTGFVEDPLTERAIQQFVRSRELPLDDYHAGNWGPHLRLLSSTVGSEAWNSRDLKSRPH